MFRNISHRHQDGFLLPVALFLVIAIAALAVGVSRLSSQATSATFREGIAMQTLYAAESGMQWGMNQLFFPDASRSTATTNCGAIEDPDPDQSELQFNVTGLQACTVDLSCTAAINRGNTISYFTLRSAATCGSGELLSERIIEATAYISE